VKAGFYFASEVSMEQYLADPCDVPSLSSGAAHDLLTKSPAHVYANHPRFGERAQDDNAASDMGTIAHALLLGGELKICEIDPQEYPAKNGNIPEGWTNVAIREARDTARDNGLIPVLKGSIRAAYDMRDAAREFIARSELAGLLDDLESEVTQIWQVGSSWMRARHDGLNHVMKYRMSYKTTQMSAAPGPFVRTSVVPSGYDVALAFYRQGFEVLTQDTTWQDVILVQEQRAPYACSLIGLDPAMWAIAQEKVARAQRMWAYCLEENQWPGYSGLVHYASPTPWQLAESEARMLEDGNE
jgi:hypothetical protein